MRQCWNNSQYRRECLEINGLPESISNENVEGTVFIHQI